MGKEARTRSQQPFRAMRRIPVWLWIFLAVALGGAGVARAYKPTTAAIPSELLGVWITDAPQYQDRTFEITQNTLVFKSSLANSSEYEVARSVLKHKSVHMTIEGSDPEMTLYEIEYQSAGKPGTFSFYLIVSPDLAIRFKNQPDMEWTKAGSD